MTTVAVDKSTRSAAELAKEREEALAAEKARRAVEAVQREANQQRP